MQETLYALIAIFWILQPDGSVVMEEAISDYYYPMEECLDLQKQIPKSMAMEPVAHGSKSQCVPIQVIPAN